MLFQYILTVQPELILLPNTLCDRLDRAAVEGPTNSNVFQIFVEKILVKHKYGTANSSIHTQQPLEQEALLFAMRLNQ